MTAAELEASLDWTCEHGEPPEEEEYEDFPELTPGELAEIREAAADELLAVGAATTGRRGPGQPGSARILPGESSNGRPSGHPAARHQGSAARRYAEPGQSQDYRHRHRAAR
jgi:hypothetical protein